MIRRRAMVSLAAAGLAGCAAAPHQGTLAELEQLEADIEEVYLDDSLDRAAESYRRYLEETSESAMTPEAMRRLADLQLEREYGVIGGGKISEMPAPDAIELPAPRTATPSPSVSVAASAASAEVAQESEQDFEDRATQQDVPGAETGAASLALSNANGESIPSGPVEAIKTYQTLLETYPNYERNDQVLYQMSRAYEELGQPDEAMQVMGRLVQEYPLSKYVDEVQFRRGEYYFVRKSYLDAEDAYGAIISVGDASSYYELALYKLGWTLYKQELYEEALDNYIAMLDYRQSIGYDFDQLSQEDDEHRVTDTFRVISLSFSNLGDAGVVDEYFARNGHRSYADKIYSNLGEFYFTKLRYDDAASVYRSFIKLNPFHRASPLFSMRVIEIFGEGGFPQLVVESKKQFAENYALDAEYWNHVEVAESPEVLSFLKTNLTDLANHYHALYQDDELIDERPESFREAQNWYRQFLRSFPQDPESPGVNYQLADLLLENEDFGGSAREYERTAYEYTTHEQSAAAGYAAVYAHRENLKAATEERERDIKQATVDSSLRFADTFRDHDQAPVILGAAADDLYDMQQFVNAIDAARKLIERYPAADANLKRSAWGVVANASIDIEEFAAAETAYVAVLELTPADDETRPAIVDGLAAAIYKQGEQARDSEDYRMAANHFLRIKDVAPTSAIRTAAEYDGAAALVSLQEWGSAAGVLESFRADYPEHELNAEATKQLAYIYREDGQIERSAGEYERIAAEATDPELGRAALLTAGELFDEARNADRAISVYERYVAQFPRPLDVALETRTRLAEMLKDQQDFVRYYAELNAIVDEDRFAADERSDRSRYLASRAALTLAERDYQAFAELELTQPFEESLAEKQRRMDSVLAALEALVDYEVAEVTSAATYYIAETYFGFSASLLESERPVGLSNSELMEYELVIEEEAFPFEERSIEVHEANHELLTTGIFNSWVEKSLERLAVMMPARYAKQELSAGFVGSIDGYAYRMPVAPPPGLDAENGTIETRVTEPADGIEAVGAPQPTASVGGQ